MRLCGQPIPPVHPGAALVRLECNIALDSAIPSISLTPERR